MIDLRHGDALEQLRTLPDCSVDLVLTDPPYNIGKDKTWDRIDNYIEWCGAWLTECCRVLRSSGTLIFWHNDMPQLAELMHWIAEHTLLVFNSFCNWHKPNFRKFSWENSGWALTLRSWFNVFEFFVVYIKPDEANERQWKKTGLDCVLSNPACFRPLKEWYRSELNRLGLTEDNLIAKYREVTGKKGFMFRHYFKDSQFEIPTEEIYNSVFKPMGFRREYEDLRREYEDLRREYEDLRPRFNLERGSTYCNYFDAPAIGSSERERFHACQKPLPILEKLIRTHSNPGELVLDPFAGSASTGVACIHTGRQFIGIERDSDNYQTARNWLETESAQLRLA